MSDTKSYCARYDFMDCDGLMVWRKPRWHEWRVK